MRARPRTWWVIAMPAVAIVAVGGLAIANVGNTAPNRPVVPHFVDDSAVAGVDHRYDGGARFSEGGGVAVFDCDDDGRPDLYLPGGARPAVLYRNESAVGGALRFSRVASAAADLTDVEGAYPIDIDSDGRIDLVVLRFGENIILRGQGDCRFERANAALGIDGGNAWTAAFSATWEGANTLPTLAFGNYLTPDQQSCAHSQLLRPAAGSRGYAPAETLAPGYCTLSILFSDWQHTGRRDLRMSNDRNYYRDGSEQLWRMEPGVPPVPYTAAEGWQPLQIWGMGIASQDVTGDRVPEVFLTSQGDNKLQTLVNRGGGPTYTDIALSRGVTASRPFAGGDVLPSTAWHAEFQDVNNDGYMDLFVTKGNVDAQPDYAHRDPSNLFLGRADGSFVEAAGAAGILDYRSARGAALVDLNHDGMLDIVVVHRGADVTLWRNTGRGDSGKPEATGNWIDVRPRQPAPNVDAVGAWIDVKTGDRVVTRELTIGGGHAGGQLGWVHFGLGPDAQAEVRVEWPDGEVGPWKTLAAGTRTIIDRESPQSGR